MVRQKNSQPIIIKRKKIVQPDAPHGGAWKVAYADFVTAMMAFFLLMWLLNATTEKQRKGLSDYFNPSVPINRISGGGEGVLGGESIFSEDLRNANGRGGDVKLTDLKDGQIAPDPLKLLQEELFDRGGESRTMEQLMRHVITRVTDEGLVIELFDLPDSALFHGETASPRPETITLAQLLGDVLQVTRNQIGVAGHVRNMTGRANDQAWNLSGARAQIMRQLLESAGLDTSRFQRVTGHSDRMPLTANPQALRNNRLEVILIRRDR